MKTAQIRGRRTFDAQQLVQSLGYSSRDVGVQLLGSLPVRNLPLEYEVALLRGPVDEPAPDAHHFQVGARVSARVAPGLRIGTAWSRREFAPASDSPGGELRHGNAYVLDVEYGDFVSGPHLIGEVITGGMDPFQQRRFGASQLLASFRFNPHGTIVTGLEPGFRASFSRVHGGAAEGGLLLTPALSAYVHGESRLTLNYSSWRPQTGAPGEHDWKILLQLAF